MAGVPIGLGVGRRFVYNEENFEQLVQISSWNITNFLPFFLHTHRYTIHCLLN